MGWLFCSVWLHNWFEQCWTCRMDLSFRVLIEHCNKKSNPRGSIVPHVSIKKGNSSSCTFWQWSQHSSMFPCGKQRAKNAVHTACTILISTLPQPVGQIGSTCEEPVVYMAQILFTLLEESFIPGSFWMFHSVVWSLD